MQMDFKALINKWSVFFFTLLWSVLITSTYLIHNKFLSKSLHSIQFASGIVIMIFAFLIFVFLIIDKKNSSFKNIIIDKFNGWKATVFFVFMCLLYFVLYGNDIKAFEDATNSYIVDFGFNLIYHLFLVVSFFFSAFIFGRTILNKIYFVIEDGLSKTIISLTFGLICFVIAFFLLASFGWFTSYSVVIITLLPLIIFYKNTIEQLKKMFIQQQDKFEIHAIALFALFVFVFFTVANVVNSFRPFPIGFDELSVYMNIPKLIANSNSLLKGGQANNWALLMAVGFLFNGDVTLATMFSILPGIFIFITIYRIAKYISSSSISLIAAASFYVLPTFLWQSSADAKIDIALCYIICSIVLLFFASYKKLTEDTSFLVSKIYSNQWVITALLLGIFTSFSFGIKYTSVIFILATLVAIVFMYSKSYSLTFSMFMSSFLALILTKVYTFSGILFSDQKEPKLLMVIAIVTVLSTLIFYFIKHKLKHLNLFVYASVFVVSLAITFSPWLIKNYTETHKIDSVSLLNGSTNQVPFIEQIKKINPLSSEINHASNHLLAQNSNTTQIPENKYSETQSSGVYEEILRYLGYEKGFVRYASIVFDMCTFKNVMTLPTDLGLFCFLFLPILFINNNKEYIVQNLLNMFLVVFFLCLSTYTVFFYPNPINLGDYMDKMTKVNPDMSSSFKQLYLILQPTLIALISALKPILIIFTKQNTFQSILLILITSVIIIGVNFKQIKSWNLYQQMLLFFTATGFIFWWILGDGISWYGIAIFGLAIILFCSIHLNDVKNNQFIYYLFLSITVFYLSYSIIQRSSSMITTYDYDSKLNRIFLQYAGKSTDETTALQDVNTAIATSIEEINANPTKKVLRIGTYMNYFIDKNNERVFEDNQLDNFTFVYNRYFGVKDVMNNSFKKIGVEYILFDLNTGSIDNTPDKTLTKKISKFYEYVSANKGITLITTDRLVEDPYSKNFMMVQGVKTAVNNSIFGTRVLKPGSVILFKIN